MLIQKRLIAGEAMHLPVIGQKLPSGLSLSELVSRQNCIQFYISLLFQNFGAFQKSAMAAYGSCPIQPGIKLVIFGHWLPMVSVCVDARRQAS